MAYRIDGRIVRNFSLAEMANTQASESTKLIFTPEMIEHAQMIQQLRDWFGKPLNVSSWYRTDTFNAAVGGDKNSAHLDGLATDITGIHPETFHDFTIAWQVICSIHGKIGGVGYYEWGMHFCSDEGRFGVKGFIARDWRK